MRAVQPPAHRRPRKPAQPAAAEFGDLSRAALRRAARSGVPGLAGRARRGAGPAAPPSSGCRAGGAGDSGAGPPKTAAIVTFHGVPSAVRRAARGCRITRSLSSYRRGPPLHYGGNKLTAWQQRRTGPTTVRLAAVRPAALPLAVVRPATVLPETVRPTRGPAAQPGLPRPVTARPPGPGTSRHATSSPNWSSDWKPAVSLLSSRCSCGNAVRNWQQSARSGWKGPGPGWQPRLPGRKNAIRSRARRSDEAASPV